MKHIAVISKDLDDFHVWKNEMKLIGESINTRKKFQTDSSTYYCVYKPTHLIGMTLDSIVETKNAKRGDAYASTVTQSKMHLKTNGQFEIDFE